MCRLPVKCRREAKQRGSPKGAARNKASAIKEARMENRQFGESVHYGTKHLSIRELSALCRDCKELAYHAEINQLDCSVSFSRTVCGLSFDGILSMIDENAHFVVIDRGTWGCPLFESREHFEVGFRIMAGPIDYFLFIYVESARMEPVAEKYGLGKL